MNLKSEQRRLFALLDTRCFVRVCADDAALWVSDYPRRRADGAAMASKLSAAGFAVRQHGALWYVDWTEARWRELQAGFVCGAPAFPAREELQEPYALCRLLLAHPAPLEAEHMPMLRRVLKLAAQPPQHMRKAVRPLYEQTAERLRRHQSVAHAAGHVLSAWLREHDDGKETRT